MQPNCELLLAPIPSTVTMAFTFDTERTHLACPFFMPDHRFDADWPFPQRLPLGAGWSGTCTARGHEGARPSDEELKTSCNLGYAKSCRRMPAERHADAVRFALGEEAGGMLHVRFSYERDYLPAGHGELLYHIATATWHEAHRDSRLQRMAECYVEAQIARRGSQADMPAATAAVASAGSD